MKNDWVDDISEMHTNFNFNQIVKEFDSDYLKMLLDFRIKFLFEELNEMVKAREDYESGLINGVKAADDTVDSLIDLCVVAIGTLDLFDIDSRAAWDRVHTKNMEKRVGIKSSRPNPLGLPDLIKPDGWVAPAHDDNIGLLSKIYS
jgi:predicted HAD superfamily Cof-like phosphohydrolase